MDATSIPSIFLHLSLFRTLRFHPIARMIPPPLPVLFCPEPGPEVVLVRLLCTEDRLYHPPPPVGRLVEFLRRPAPVVEPLVALTPWSILPGYLLDVREHQELVQALEV